MNMCGSLHGPPGLLPAWLLALLVLSFLTLFGAPLARGTTSQRFLLGLVFFAALFTVQGIPQFPSADCGQERLAHVGFTLLAGATLAAAAVGGMTMAVRSRQETVSTAVRARILLGSIAGIGVVLGSIALALLIFD